MRHIWKGSIAFGLVNIPVGLGTAVRTEELSFRMLREGDLSRIRFKRVHFAQDIVPAAEVRKPAATVGKRRWKWRSI